MRTDKHTKSRMDGYAESNRFFRKYAKKPNKYKFRIFTYYFRMKIYMYEAFMNICV
jgi:hypothetical protein